MTRTCPPLQLRRVLSRLSSGARRGAGGRPARLVLRWWRRTRLTPPPSPIGSMRWSQLPRPISP